MMQQPYQGIAPGFPQQPPQGNPTGALLGSQPLPPSLASHGSLPASDASFVPGSGLEGVAPVDPPESDAMIVGAFPGLEGGDLHPDLALAQSMPFSASEMNLANMVGSCPYFLLLLELSLAHCWLQASLPVVKLSKYLQSVESESMFTKSSKGTVAPIGPPPSCPRPGFALTHGEKGGGGG